MVSQVAAVVAGPLDLSAVVAAAAAYTATGPAGHGAIVTFLGTVRPETAGRRVVAIEYEAHEALAARVFDRIGKEAAAWWPTVRLVLSHRIGRLTVGEASVAIAAAAPHRAEAFAACRYAIERVKQVAPIWKREMFEGGDAWIEGAAVDPDDETAREEAYRRACG